MIKKVRSLPISRINPYIALGVGVFLWFIPTIFVPVLKDPISDVLKNFGLLAPSAGAFESMFTSALVLRWVAVAALIFFVLKIEKLPLSSVGIKKPAKKDFLLMISLGLALMIVTMIIYSIFKFDTNTQTGQIVTTLSVLGKLHLILNAAIVEELFFRGFLIERANNILRNIWLAGFLSFILFVVSHIEGSGVLHSLLPVALGTIVFVILYIKRRNLFTCIGAHAISNLIMLLA